MKNTALLGALILAIAVTHTGAFFLGRLGARPAPAVTDVSACDAKTGTTVDQRNAAWRVWNGDASGPATPEKVVAAAVGAMIHPKSGAESRQGAQNIYLLKALASFDEAEAKELGRALAQGTAQERAAALAKLVNADARGANLAKALLADTERVKLFISEQKVPLEQ